MAPVEALRLIEAGESPGSKHSPGPVENVAYFNPHLLRPKGERNDHHRNFFAHLSTRISCYLFNSGRASVKDLINIVSEKTEEASLQEQ
jgi:hypothetical protein